MDNKSKYISIIYTGRNDDYAKGFIHRFNTSLSVLSYLTKKIGLDKDIEIIIVEWNPADNKDKLKKVLLLPKNIDTRIIEVPKRIHDKIPKTKYDAPNAESIPFYEFVGKNAAVRRANSSFVLCSNPDIILNEKLIDFLSKKTLSAKNFYRIDKDSLLHDVNASSAIEDQLNLCESDLDRKMQSKNLVCRKRYVHTKAAGDFLLMSKGSFEKMQGFLEIRTGGGALDRFGVYCASTVCKQIILDPPLKIFHQPHVRRCKIYDKEISPKDVNMEYLPEHSTFTRKDIKKWFTSCLEKMEKQKINMNVNDKNWGLIKYNLEEEFFPRE